MKGLKKKMKIDKEFGKAARRCRKEWKGIMEDVRS